MSLSHIHIQARRSHWSIDEPFFFFQVLMQAALQEWFRTLIMKPQLYVEAAIQLTRSSQKIRARRPAVSSIVSTQWETLEAVVLRRFEEQDIPATSAADMNKKPHAVVKCDVKTCRRAWSAEGTPLLSCGGCRSVAYCSKACQRSYVVLFHPLSASEKGHNGDLFVTIIPLSSFNSAWKAHKSACRVK